MLGLAEAIKPRVETVFALFPENGLYRPFLNQVRQAGFNATRLANDTPRLIAARREIVQLTRDLEIDVVLCHGYKATTIGWAAARRAGIPVVAVSRGWTAESWTVRIYERLDRWMLPRMDRVVCVSRAQAEKVLASGTSPNRVDVIHNSVVAERFGHASSKIRRQLQGYFPAEEQANIRTLIGAAGRLSPEKGFDLLVQAAVPVIKRHGTVGFVLFGDGPLREALRQKINELGINSRFALAGFTEQLDQFLPNFDLFVQSSYTEGLPNVLLEALASGVPVVATDVGGSREVLDDGKRGWLVEAGNVGELANTIQEALASPSELRVIAADGQRWIDQQFTFAKQAQSYQSVLAEVTKK